MLPGVGGVVGQERIVRARGILPVVAAPSPAGGGARITLTPPPRRGGGRRLRRRAQVDEALLRLDRLEGGIPPPRCRGGRGRWRDWMIPLLGGRRRTPESLRVDGMPNDDAVVVVVVVAPRSLVVVAARQAQAAPDAVGQEGNAVVVVMAATVFLLLGGGRQSRLGARGALYRVAVFETVAAGAGSGDYCGVGGTVAAAVVRAGVVVVAVAAVAEGAGLGVTGGGDAENVGEMLVIMGMDNGNEGGRFSRRRGVMPGERPAAPMPFQQICYAFYPKF